MQGSFALRPDPFAGVAELAGIAEDEVLERVQYLLDKRIIREITPIFDTRALGYSSMLVAAKVDAANPHRAAQFINSHPGVTHNYLRNHEFNLWFTLAVEPDSKLGLDGTLDVMAAKTGAESIRQLPTLKLFKIRMDLEMEGGTDALKTAVEPVEPMELDPIELTDDRHRGDPRHAGPDGGAQRRLRARRRAARPAAWRTCWRAWSRCASAAACAASPRSSTTAARASPPTAWACGRCRRARSSTPAAGWPRSAGSRTATSARPTPTGPTPSSRWPTAAPRRSATRSSTRSPSTTGIERARDAVLEHRVQEGPDALLHRRLQALGRGARVLSSLLPLGHALGRALPARAARPPGRRELAGAGDARDRARPDLRRARVRRRAHRRRRQRLRRLRVLVGPADPRPRAPRRARGRDRGGGARDVATARRRPARSSSPSCVCARMPSVDMLRMTSSGTEASMSAIRLARAVTGRDMLLKFAGAYHGHVDGLLAQAGSGLATQGIPASPGVPAAAAAQTVVVPGTTPRRCGRRSPSTSSPPRWSSRIRPTWA